MTLVKEKRRDYHDAIHQIKELMRLGNLTLDDIAPHAPREESREDMLKRLAGSWKHKDIDSLLASHQRARDQLSTL